MDSQTLQAIVDAEIERLRGEAPVCATVHEGVVTLTGAVQDHVRRVMIEQELLQLPEVLDVHNHLRVAAPAHDARAQLLALVEREGATAAGVEIEVGAAASPSRARPRVGSTATRSSGLRGRCRVSSPSRTA